jgi:hypothetical protein
MENVLDIESYYLARAGLAIYFILLFCFTIIIIDGTGVYVQGLAPAIALSFEPHVPSPFCF